MYNLYNDMTFTLFRSNAPVIGKSSVRFGWIEKQIPVKEYWVSKCEAYKANNSVFRRNIISRPVRSCYTR